MIESNCYGHDEHLTEIENIDFLPNVKTQTVTDDAIELHMAAIHCIC